MEDLKIKAIPTDKSKIPQCPAAAHGLIPKHPFRMMVCGASGSGKSNFILNLLSRECFYKGYFDHVFVLSPTASHLDDSYKVLELDEENFFMPEIKVLKRIREIQDAKIKKVGIEKAPKVCIILDDWIGFKKFANSSALIRFAIMSRHWSISLLVLTQAYHRVKKPIRLNMSCLIYFKGSNKEIETLTDDYCAAGYSKKAFIGKINYATQNQYEFLFIDLNIPICEGRYRKNLDEQLI